MCRTGISFVQLTNRRDVNVPTGTARHKKTASKGGFLASMMIMDGDAWCPGETRTKLCERRQTVIVSFKVDGLLTFLLTFLRVVSVSHSASQQWGYVAEFFNRHTFKSKQLTQAQSCRRQNTVSRLELCSF